MSSELDKRIDLALAVVPSSHDDGGTVRHRYWHPSTPAGDRVDEGPTVRIAPVTDKGRCGPFRTPSPPRMRRRMTPTQPTDDRSA
jgi:hypothetical protein